MKREDAKSKAKMLIGCCVADETYSSQIIDQIYNYFESRTCERCIHSQFGPTKEPCRPQRYRCALLGNRDVEDDFGCNKFEPKDD